MNALVSVLLNAIAVFVAAYITPGVDINGFMTAAVVAIVLGMANTFIRPIVFVLTLPINILTLGLFSFVIIAGFVLMVSMVVPGFIVSGWLSALMFAGIMALVNAFLVRLSQPQY